MTMTGPQRVLDIAEAVRAILTTLDFASVDKYVAQLKLDPSGRTYLQDSDLWHELIMLHFHDRIPDDLAFLALPQKDRGWNWTDRTAVCPELQEFLRVGDERDHFICTVSIVSGDIGKIANIDGVPLDGLAFPTNSYLTNHFTGAAAAVFRRAGKRLSDLVMDVDFRRRRDVGDAVATPGFDAGVRTLIHCVGPRLSQDHCFERLYATYTNALNTVLAEELHCVAIASISTGALSIPPKLGAQFGLRAIQRFIRANHWEGKIAIVCYDDKVLEAFQEQYQMILADFNTIPPFPHVTPEMWN